MGTYEHGDFVKVEFEDEGPLPGEWMWVRVDRCDDERQLIFGMLDSEPLVTTGTKLGQELVISYEKVREHRKPWEFKKN
jgi:hypothetical protein